MYNVYFQLFDEKGKLICNCKALKVYKSKSGAQRFAKKLALMLNTNCIVAQDDPFVAKD